jgi:proline iminopeptidase
MRDLYPEIAPYSTEVLAVGDGQVLRIEQYGHEAGKPVVFLHGGPGGATSAKQARFWDPARYRIVLFDQRGCGRSSPHAADPGTDMSLNTTWHLVSDIEAVRQHLGIDRWQVFGGSWGSALALAYAEKHPDRVTEMLLRGIFTLRRFELDWFYNGPAGLIAPVAWAGFCQPLIDAGMEPVDRLDTVVPGKVDNIAAYSKLLWDPDPAVATAAAIAWTVWETSVSGLGVTPGQIRAAASDTRAALAFARIENHYFVNGGFFEEGQLIRDVDWLRDIPCVVVQGAYDLCCPQRTARDLIAAWPEAQLHVVHAGHSVFEPAIVDVLVRATGRFGAPR